MPRPVVIVLASQKGGVGKTALSAHLAVAAEATGNGPVVLYDTDPQQSLAEWWQDREAETPQLARGGVTEAYGFDLSPIAARYPEFVRLAEEARAERAEMGRLRRRATAQSQGAQG